MPSLLTSRFRYALPLVLLPLAASAPSVACSSDDDSASPVDAGSDAEVDASALGDDDDAGVYLNDASVVCTLDDGTDPAALCTQKVILAAWKASARLKTGVAAAWSTTTGLPVADGGTVTHDLHSDLGYGASLANYHLAASCYGDTTITASVDADLLALQPTVLADFAPLPSEYDGEVYFHLRRIAAGLRYQNQDSAGDAVDQVAEAYGAAIATSFFLDRGPEQDAGAATADGGSSSDGGSVSDAGDGGDAGEAGAGPAGSDAGDAGAALVLDDGVIGTIGGGIATYTTVDSATGALALLDLASRHTGDNPPAAARWERMAIEALDHLYLHGRDPSGFYYAGGTTAADGGSTDSPTDPLGASGYTFTMDVQGPLAALFLQAATYASTNPALTTANAYPLAKRGQDLFAVIEGTPSLYDATHLGFFNSITPSTGAIDTTKTILANAAMIGFLGDDGITGTSAVAQSQKLASAPILGSTALGQGFLGLMDEQTAYEPAATATFGPVPGFDGNYTSRATTAGLDGLMRQLPATCGQ